MRDAAALGRNFDLGALYASLPDGPLPDLPRPARARPGQAPARRRVPDALRHVDRVYRDTAAFSSDKREELRPKYGGTPFYEHHTTSLVFNNPPLHTRVRQLIAGALTPWVIAEMEPDLVLVVGCVAGPHGRAGPRRPDRGLRRRHPCRGHRQPARRAPDERGPLRDWLLAILGTLEPDERLTEWELLHNCVSLPNAGHETTTNLIGNGPSGPASAGTSWSCPRHSERPSRSSYAS